MKFITKFFSNKTKIIETLKVLYTLGLTLITIWA